MTGTADSPAVRACPYCGWPDDAEPLQVLSRHTTASGHTVWTRCGCGSLQIRVVDGAGLRMVSRSRPSGTGTPARTCGETVR
ncbi:hypothetical protein ACFV6E_31585 [Streptomyces sp. NPDC059785]|uniref:hypothetical protein n=1 Tax=unclassified Streptomyces TaxID=2593676 RepID=UPI00365CF7B2